MKMAERTTRILLLFVICGYFASAPQIAHGQPSCGQYSLNYLMRDERGKVMDANADGLWIGPGWSVNDRKLYDVPQTVNDMIGKRNFLSYIKYYEPCHFKEPIRLQLTL